MACDTQVVTIHQDGTVDPREPLELSKKAKQRIVWLSESNQDYDVQFEQGTGSPFKHSDFTVPAGGWAESKEIRADANLGTYTYHTVDPKTNQVAADPDVIISG